MKNSADFSRILIVSCRQIGDALITTPLIHRARQLWPQAEIDFLCLASAAPMLQGHPDLNQVIETQRKQGWRASWALLKKITRRYDLALISQPNDRSYIYGLLAAPERVAVGRPGRLEPGWKRWFLRALVPVDYFHQHVVTEKLKLLQTFEALAHGLPAQAVAVTPPAKAALPASVQLPPHYVVIHPTPLTAYKRWPLEYWVALIEFITGRAMPVVISGGPDRADAELRDALLARLSASARAQVIDLTGQLQFAQLSGVLEQASAYIGVDTAISHQAAACGVPTIALFGPTPPTNFGPWPNGFTGEQPYLLKAPCQTIGNVTLIQGEGACVPCRRSGCDDTPNSRSRCLDELSPSRVIAAYQALAL